MKIRKAVIPVAGFGTRFLPQTKAMPKGMLPVVDKPVIQYIVEDLVNVGIEQVILVTGWDKRAIEDHFDDNAALEEILRASHKLEILEQVKRISNMADFVYVRQKGPMGNGTPLMNVKNVVGDEPFYWCWGDEIMASNPIFAKQLIETYYKYQCTIVGCVEKSAEKDYLKYGYALGAEVEDGVLKIDKFDEKPGKKGNKISSDYATIGGVVFTPGIFEAIERAAKELKGGDELYYNDGLNLLLGKEAIYGKKVKGARHYDCGDKLSYLQTVVEFGLQHPDVNGEFKEFLKGLEL